MKTICPLLFVLLAVVAASPISAQPATGDFRVEGSVAFSMFQQQVKSEIGTEPGEPLVNESELAMSLNGTYGLFDFLSVGLFMRGGFGNRENAQFAGFEEDGRTQVQNQLGGSYSEFWFGPLLHFHWKQFFIDGGYALYGMRTDDGRSDLPSATGDTTSAFSTDPSFAFLVSAGGNLPVSDNIAVVLKIDYAIRYYNQRGGEPLANNIVHGTQSLAPSIGVAWTP